METGTDWTHTIWQLPYFLKHVTGDEETAYNILAHAIFSVRSDWVH